MLTQFEHKNILIAGVTPLCCSITTLYYRNV